jgi:hypothetical protein
LEDTPNPSHRAIGRALAAFEKRIGKNGTPNPKLRAELYRYLNDHHVPQLLRNNELFLHAEAPQGKGKR